MSCSGSNISKGQSHNSDPSLSEFPSSKFHHHANIVSEDRRKERLRRKDGVFSPPYISGGFQIHVITSIC